MNNIVDRFKNNVEGRSESIALEVQGKQYSYKELWSEASLLSTILSTTKKVSDSTVVGILAYRSLYVYSGILATLKSGMSYMPFNPKFPVDRLIKMINISGCKILIVASEFQNLISQIIPYLEKDVVIIMPEEKRNNNYKHKVFFYEDLKEAISDNSICEVNLEQPVYILFTSGTTGEPKGIPVSHSNLKAYIDFVQDKYPVCSDDICSQAFDTTFDPSEHDIWVTWNAGARLVVVPTNDLLSPAKFIVNKNLTVWYSVPSIASFMVITKMLKPNIFPKLRYSIFSGEALPADLAAKFQDAAPNSTLINYYGPTEVTINITDYVWKKGISEIESINNIVPLGPVFNTHKYLIVDTDFKPVPFGSEGELIISGVQVTAGYIGNPQKTAEQYIKIPNNSNDIWYRTGDLVKENKEGCIFYLGRIDDQVKIRGYRVELQEIEKVILDITASIRVVAVAHPVNNGIAEGTVTFVLGKKEMPDSEILAQAQKKLPEYMIPKRIIYLEQLPFNTNGKVDKKELKKLLEE